MCEAIFVVKEAIINLFWSHFHSFGFVFCELYCFTINKERLRLICFIILRWFLGE